MTDTTNNNPAGSALAEIASLKSDREFVSAYADAGHIGHKAAVERMTRLHEAAYAATPSGAPAAPGAVTPPPAAPGAESVGTEAPSDPAAEIDKFFPPARPEQYEMPAFAEPGEEYGAAHVEADKLARGWLSEARFPREIGSHIAKEAARVAGLVKSMTPETRELWAQGQKESVEKMLGPAAPKKLALAQQLIRELEAKNPGVVNFLEATGAGNSAAIVVQVAEHAARLAARRGIRIEG
ncbi:MAG: hypothetical protein ING19_01460 [Azospirillum sp.]|nr:hypothetical protein [Azospirillum sp.]MCA3264709.1 hypothetical protein [Azospirillum sp.]